VTSIAAANITDLRAVWHHNVAGINWNTAGGSANALTVTMTPAVASLVDGLILALRAAYANTSATVTFAPNGLTAYNVTRQGGQPLLIGDIQPNQEIFLRYNLANTRWELLNPGQTNIPWAIAGGSANALTLTNTPPVATLYDGLLVSGRAASANTTTAPTLNVDGLGAKTVTMQGGAALAAGSMAQYGEYLFRYNLANTRWELLNPIAGGGVQLVKVTMFTSSGTFTPQSNTKYCNVKVAGATGGGGAAVSPFGTAGGTTSFGSLVIANGGAGGTNSGGANASAGTGNIALAGGSLIFAVPFPGGTGVVGVGNPTCCGCRTGGAGGQGGYSESVVTIASVGASQSVTVGARGTRANAGATYGNPGCVVVYEFG
jgi:hypothetical protein